MRPLLTPANILAVLFIAAVLFGSSALCFASVLPAGSGGTFAAVVHASDGQVYELPLEVDTTLEVCTDEGSNTVTVSEGRVFMQEADCDGHDCMYQGYLSAPGGQIICLPHKLWIEVVETGSQDAQSEDGLDVISR